MKLLARDLFRVVVFCSVTCWLAVIMSHSHRKMSAFVFTIVMLNVFDNQVVLQHEELLQVR